MVIHYIHYETSKHPCELNNIYNSRTLREGSAGKNYKGSHVTSAAVLSKAVVLLLLIHFLLLLPLRVFLCVCSSFCSIGMSVISSFATISPRKRKRHALL